MPREIVPGSINKTWAEQIAMIPAEYEVPLAVEEVTKPILHYRKNGSFPYSVEAARCWNVTSKKFHTVVAAVKNAELYVFDSCDEKYDMRIGLAASRKPKILPVYPSLTTLSPQQYLSEGSFLAFCKRTLADRTKLEPV